MASDKNDDVKKVDLTDPNAVEQVSDEELDKVAGGFGRTTLSTTLDVNKTLTTKPTINAGDIVQDTIYAGMPDDVLNFGGTFDKLKR